MAKKSVETVNTYTQIIYETGRRLVAIWIHVTCIYTLTYADQVCL